MADHKGHRQRLLLFYAIPQRDTNPIAHDLLDRFGSLHQVLEAPSHELEKVAYIGEQASTLLNLTKEIARGYLVSEVKREKILSNTIECGKYLMRFFVGKRDEVVYLLCLDSKCQVLSCREVGKGSVNSVGLSIRRVVETALSVNATSVILAHNHPTGFAFPSPEDVMTTRRVAMAMDAVGIILADHIVVAGDDFVSLVSSDYYRPEECRLPM